MAVLRTELANLRVAWQWATYQQQHDLLADSVDVLSDFYEASGLLCEAEQVLGEAVQTIHGQAANHAQVACEAKVTLALLHILRGQGMLTAAEAWRTCAQELAQATGDPAIVFSNVRTLLHLRQAQGAYNEEAQAVPLLQKAHAQLQARAAQLHATDWRTVFLTQVAAHRALVTEYASVIGAPQK